MNTIYTITVMVTRNEEVVQSRRWIGKSDDKKEDVYSPEFLKTEKVERKIYSQEVNNLDLVAVIQAVNKS